MMLSRVFYDDINVECCDRVCGAIDEDVVFWKFYNLVYVVNFNVTWKI